ncbi:MAG: DUF438 domain-containing protein [Fibrobacter sp.]|jgi:DUF438 domain-containing protein|nr:DUF438 domain-containing protein [Fibrobacter sp.]
MELSPKTKITELITRYDFMLDYLVELSPKFKLLKNPVARKTVGNIATISQAASIGGLNVDEMIKKISAKIQKETGEAVSCSSGDSKIEHFEDAEARQEVLKEIIKDLHAGAKIESVKSRFRELIKDTDASEISKMEEALIAEGMASEEVKRLCDVHVQVFKESLEEKDAPAVPEGHPVHTFMLENRTSEEIMNKIGHICSSLSQDASDDFGNFTQELQELVSSLMKIDIHYLRKENQLFPYLEKIDISGPTQVMWALDDDIRKMLKKSASDLSNRDKKAFIESINEAIQTIRDMIYKEEHILFPLSIEKLPDEVWEQIRSGEPEIGYAWIEPASTSIVRTQKEESFKEEDTINLDTGKLSIEQINLMLKSLPVDISFVDENDTVAYYSATKERIFPRSPAVIGRKVQNCHPPQSVHVVQKILDDFRSGKRDTAEFWIQIQGKFIHIRYFAVRNDEGVYRGCLEVSQDVTEIRKLEGDKRLLD